MKNLYQKIASIAAVIALLFFIPATLMASDAGEGRKDNSATIVIVIACITAVNVVLALLTRNRRKKMEAEKGCSTVFDGSLIILFGTGLMLVIYTISSFFDFNLLTLLFALTGFVNLACYYIIAFEPCPKEDYENKTVKAVILSYYNKVKDFFKNRLGKAAVAAGGAVIDQGMKVLDEFGKEMDKAEKRADWITVKDKTTGATKRVKDVGAGDILFAGFATVFPYILVGVLAVFLICAAASLLLFGIAFFPPVRFVRNLINK